MLKTALARYTEHKKKYPTWSYAGHSKKAIAMYLACEALYEEKRNGK